MDTACDDSNFPEGRPLFPSGLKSAALALQSAGVRLLYAAESCGTGAAKRWPLIRVLQSWFQRWVLRLQHCYILCLERCVLLVEHCVPQAASAVQSSERPLDVSKPRNIVTFSSLSHALAFRCCLILWCLGWSSPGVSVAVLGCVSMSQTQT